MFLLSVRLPHSAPLPPILSRADDLGWYLCVAAGLAWQEATENKDDKWGKKKRKGRKVPSLSRKSKKDLLRFGIVLVGQYCLSHGVELLSDLTSVGLCWLKRQAKHNERINTSPISPQQHRLLTTWITGHRVLTCNAHLKLP